MTGDELKAKVVDFLFTVAYIKERRGGFRCAVEIHGTTYQLAVSPDTKHGRLIWSLDPAFNAPNVMFPPATELPAAQTLADLTWHEWGQLLAFAEEEHDEVFEPS